MRKNVWLLAATGLAVLVASSTASAQRGRRGFGGSGFSVSLGNGLGYGSPYYGGYGYRPYSGYTGYGGYYNQPYYSYSRPIISTPYYSGTTYYSGPTTYQSQPLYSANDTAGQMYEQGTAVASTDQSNYYTPTWHANGTITILVPDQAQVWFGDIPTSVQGSTRSFQLPALDSGRDYTYTIRAKWMENGREHDQTKVVTFRAGQSFTVDMRTASATSERITTPPLPPQPSR